MKSTKLRTFKMIVLLAMLGSSFLSADAQDANAQNGPTLHVGDSAPKLVVGRWVKGEPIADFKKGHVYVLDFWATWCVPCRESMPHMSALARQYRDRATFIAMNVSETPRKDRDVFTMVDAFVKMMGNKLDTHVAMDNDASLVNHTWLRAAGIRSIPSVFIVDQESKIAWIGQPQGVDSVLAAVVAGTFDAAAFAKRSASQPKRQAIDDKAIAALMPIRQALMAKDYPLTVSLYEKFMQDYPANSDIMKGTYVRALAHVSPETALKQLVTLKGSEQEYEVARALSEDEGGLDKKFYAFVADYFTRRSENDFFAMGKVAKAYFASGDIAKAVAVQKKFVADLRLPTTPSTDEYIRREEETLKKYTAAMQSGKSVN